jgi:hypothetical protein
VERAQPAWDRRRGTVAAATMETRLRLDPDKLRATAEQLARRIDERFPGSGLHAVCVKLVARAAHADEVCVAIRKPNLGMRVLSASVITLIVAGAIGAAVVSFQIGGSERFGLGELIQVSEALVNDLILLGAAIYFFVMLERRAKRGRVIEAVSDLRSLAHLIDVHQLAKTPETLGRHRQTASSPKRSLAPWELGRYLDYCSEMLSLTGKVGALYADAFEDSQALEAVTDLEELTIGLQRKIWQKLVTLESRAARLKIPMAADDE